MSATYTVQGTCDLCGLTYPTTATLESTRALQLAHEISEHLATGSKVKYYCSNSMNYEMILPLEGFVTFYELGAGAIYIDNEVHPVEEITEVLS